MDNNSTLQASSILSLFQTNKEQRQSFATQIIDGIKNGNINALNVHLQLKCMANLSEMISEDKEYKEAVKNEGIKYKGTTYQNAKVDIREVGVKYDYSVCGDNEINALLSKMEALKAEIKEREKFLKAIPSDGMTIIDDNSGEVVKLYPPNKLGSESVVLTLK